MTDFSSDYMGRSVIIRVCILLLATLTAHTGYSQLGLFKKNSKKKAEEAVVLDSLPHDIELNIYRFEDINKPGHYKNDAKLNRIRKYYRDQNWERLYVALKDYVRNFRIQNFYKDTRLIWRLAKLEELYGDEEKARDLYRLVLRHHHEGIDINEIEIYYDTLNNMQADQFVPVEYYYELVEHRSMIDTLRPPRGVLLNMGTQVNSQKADYGPALNIQNDILIFTSKRNSLDLSIRKVYNEDLFYTYKDAYGRWAEAKEMRGLNSKYNEGSATLSRDGRTLYFSRCECIDCYGDCDLFVTTLSEDSIWTDVKNLGINVNSLSWDSHPSLSHSEDTLYFASDRLGGFGLADVYFTYKQSNGEWAPAKNLGPVINTRQNDVSPFYHPKFKMLYFTSNGQLYNFGEYDIFKAEWADEGFWEEPRNIGPLVNGTGSEFYFTIDSDSENLFYARSATRDLTKQDLYSFPLPMEAQPNANTTFSGSLTDSISGAPFKGIVSIIDLDEGVEVAPRYLRPDGSFEFNLIDQRNYLVIIQGDDFFRIEEAFFLDGPLEMHRVTEPLTARVKFESIEFDVGAAELKPGMYGDLNKIVNFLYDNIDFKLRIAGHTDSFGAEDYNLELSEVRARVIRDYIVEFAGIYEGRVEYQGYGSSQPIVVESTEADAALNRRVEFEIYRPAQPTVSNEPEGN